MRLRTESIQVGNLLHCLVRHGELASRLTAYMLVDNGLRRFPGNPFRHLCQITRTYIEFVGVMAHLHVYGVLLRHFINKAVEEFAASANQAYMRHGQLVDVVVSHSDGVRHTERSAKECSYFLGQHTSHSVRITTTLLRFQGGEISDIVVLFLHEDIRMRLHLGIGVLNQHIATSH